MSTVQSRLRTSARQHQHAVRRQRCCARLGLESLEDRRVLSGVSPLAIDDPHDVTVMSRNLYIGADLGPVLAAGQSGNQGAIVGAIGAFWRDVQLRDFPARAEAFVDEITQQQPALIGLQEVAQFIAGDVYYPNQTVLPGTAITLDYLDILLSKLDERGLSYSTVVSTNGFGGVFTGLVDAAQFGLQDIHYVDRDVILARTDLPAPAMLLSNAHGGNFATSMQVPFAGSLIPIKRSWNSVDVQMWGQDFRFVSTHLEDDNPLIPQFGMAQEAQAYELVSPGGPTDVDMPVILVGDFNSNADGTGTDTYGILTAAAGFTDSWIVTHASEPGYTWSQNDDLRSDPVTAVPPPAGALEQIDLLLYRGGQLRAQDMDRVMAPVTPSDPAKGPLWSSDHAGVAAAIGLQVAANGQPQPWVVVNDDPLHPGERAIFIVGTDGRDQIRIDPSGSDRLAVTMTMTRGTYQPTRGGQIYVHAAAGNDVVRLSPSVKRDAVIYAGLGDDVVYGGSGNDEIHGGDGRDFLYGEAGQDVLDGGAGADLLSGGLGNDSLSGGDGGDLLYGGAGNDVLAGGAGDDWLFGGAGHDRLFGELGDDWLFGEAGDDELDGGPGFDWLFGGAGHNVLRRGEHLWNR